MIWKVIALALFVAAAMTLVRALAGGIHALDVIPRRRWLSIAGGAAVAYAFVHLLLERGRRQSRWNQQALQAPDDPQHIDSAGLADLVST